MCIIAGGILLVACSKDKFNTVPEIKFKSLSPNAYVKTGFVNTSVTPKLTIELTDAEGDFGDTSYVYITNLLNVPNTLDSVLFPAITGISKKNLSVNVQVDFEKGQLLTSPPLPLPRPYIDTVFYEVYVKDQAKNKSNTISVGPVYLISE